MPHTLAVFVALLVGVAAVTLLLNIVYTSVRELASNASSYEHRIKEIAGVATSLLARRGVISSESLKELINQQGKGERLNGKNYLVTS